MTNLLSIFLDLICPSMGVLMATIMFAAPIADLRRCLIAGEFLNDLNPFPWTMMTGNCLGWLIYGFYQHDPFLIAANLPGFFVSLWLNMGATKLQYYHHLLLVHNQSNMESEDDIITTTDLDTALMMVDEQSPPPRQEQLEEPEENIISPPQHIEELEDDISSLKTTVLVPQEMALLRVLTVWSILLIWVGFFTPPPDAAALVGMAVNLNLLFFYAAPLQTLRKVLKTGSSNSIHRPTMIMNWLNTSFWIAYGLLAKHDKLIWIPNAIGLALGIAQGFLCLCFPLQQHDYHHPQPQDHGSVEVSQVMD